MKNYFLYQLWWEVNSITREIGNSVTMYNLHYVVGVLGYTRIVFFSTNSKTVWSKEGGKLCMCVYVGRHKNESSWLLVYNNVVYVTL